MLRYAVYLNNRANPMNRKPVVRFFTLLFLSFALLSAPRAAELKLGIHPYLLPQELLDRFTPLSRYLSEKTNHAIRVTVSASYQDHVNRIGGGDLDIAFLGPSLYIELERQFGEIPLLARMEIKSRPRFQGTIIVRQDSPLEELKDLEGHSFAFGSPHSTMSHLLPRYMLIQAGIDNRLSAYSYLGNHESVALSVLLGQNQAGAVKEEVYEKYKERGLRALAWTPEISEHLFIAGAHLPEEITDSLREALLDLRQHDPEKVILSALKKNTTALVAVKDQDYDNLRKIMEVLKSHGYGPNL